MSYTVRVAPLVNGNFTAIVFFLHSIPQTLIFSFLRKYNVPLKVATLVSKYI